MRGFVAQGMTGAKPRTRAQLYRVSDTIVAGSGTLTIAETGQIEVFAWAGGASGSFTTVPGGNGGGAGGGIRRRMRVIAGQVLGYTLGAGGAGQTTPDTIGNPGGDTTITFPDSLIAVAVGGVVTAGGGYRVTGDATGSTGGAGGIGGNAGAAGADSGGAGGALSGSSGGGGGAAGFATYTTGLSYGAGSPAISATMPGSGAGSGGSTGATQAGGAGRLLVYFMRD